MGQWDSRIRDHAVWTALNEVGRAIDNAKTRETIEPDSIESLERVRAMLAFIGKRLAATDPIIAFPGPLDTIAAQLTETVQSLTAFASSGDAGHLTTSNKKMDIALHALAQLPVLATSDDLTTLSEAAANFRESLSQHVSQLNATTSANQEVADGLKGRLDQLTASLDKEKERLGGLVATYESQFNTAQSGRGETFTRAEADRKASFDGLVKTWTEDFELGQEQRDKAFDKLISDFTEALDAQKDEFSTQGKAALDAYKLKIGEMEKEYAAAAQKILDQIQTHKAEVEKLVGIIGNLGVSSGYQKTANQARDSLVTWQRVTVGALIGVAAVTLLMFGPSVLQGQQINWEVLVAKLLVTVTVGIIAAYAASQADKQYRIEKTSRRLALEFEALGPYLAPLPEDQQHAFRIAIGHKSFGQADDAHPAIADRSPATLIHLLADEIQKDAGLLDKTKDLFKDAVERLFVKKSK